MQGIPRQNPYRKARRPLQAALALLTLCILLTATLPAQAQNQDWPVFQRDARHLGAASGSGLDTPLKVAWQVKMPQGHEIKSSPIVAGGAVIVATTEGHVAAYDTDSATLLWTYDAGDRIEGTPAVDNDRVFVTTWNDSAAAVTGKVHVLELKTGKALSGTPKDLGGGSWGGASIFGGRLFLGLAGDDAKGKGGKIVAYETTSMTKLWEFSTAIAGNATYPAKSVRANPLIADNVVYFGAFNHLFYAVDANDGSEIWVEDLNAILYSSGAIDPAWKSGQVEGIVYMGSYDGKMYAFDVAKEQITGNCQTSRDKQPKGHTCSDIRVWTYEAGAPIYSSPAVANGKVYFGDNTGKVHAVHQGSVTFGNPKVAWTATTGDGVFGSPAVLDDKIVVGSYDGKLYVFTEDAEGGLADTWSVKLSDKIHSSPAVADNRVFIASQDGVLYTLVGAESDAEIIGDAGGGGTPDLTIGDIQTTPRKMVEGQPFEFAVTVVNEGEGPSGAIDVRFYNGEALQEERSVEVAAGKDVTVTFKLLIAPAEGNFIFVVDEEDLVVESSEDNNRREQNLVASEGTGGSGDDGAETEDNTTTEDGDDESGRDADAPAPGFMLVLVAVALLVAAVRRRRV